LVFFLLGDLLFCGDLLLEGDLLFLLALALALLSSLA